MTTSPRQAFSANAWGSRAILNALGEDVTLTDPDATVKAVFMRRSDRDYRTNRMIHVDEMRAQEADVGRERAQQRVVRASNMKTYEISAPEADSTGWLKWRATECDPNAGG